MTDLQNFLVNATEIHRLLRASEKNSREPEADALIREALRLVDHDLTKLLADQDMWTELRKAWAKPGKRKDPRGFPRHDVAVLEAIEKAAASADNSFRADSALKEVWRGWSELVTAHEDREQPSLLVMDVRPRLAEVLVTFVAAYEVFDHACLENQVKDKQRKEIKKILRRTVLTSVIVCTLSSAYLDVPAAARALRADFSTLWDHLARTPDSTQPRDVSNGPRTNTEIEEWFNSETPGPDDPDASPKVIEVGTKRPLDPDALAHVPPPDL